MQSGYSVALEKLCWRLTAIWQNGNSGHIWKARRKLGQRLIAIWQNGNSAHIWKAWRKAQFVSSSNNYNFSTPSILSVKSAERGDYEKLNADGATKHDEKRYLQAIDFKMDSMNDTFNGPSTMATKAIAILSTAPLEDPEQKELIEREEKDLQAELEQYKDRISEFPGPSHNPGEDQLRGESIRWTHIQHAHHVQD